MQRRGGRRGIDTVQQHGYRRMSEMSGVHIESYAWWVEGFACPASTIHY